MNDPFFLSMAIHLSPSNIPRIKVESNLESISDGYNTSDAFLPILQSVVFCTSWMNILGDLIEMLEEIILYLIGNKMILYMCR